MAPSKQSREVFADLSAQADAELARLRKLEDNEVKQLNQMIRDKGLPVIGVRRD
jgi:hypothetical protein